MANTLLDKVESGRKKLVRGPGGQLVEETTELATTPTPTPQLADQYGLAAPPTTAVGVGMLGGNEHQQKMAGTPAQMGNALRMSAEATEVLSSADRRRQARTEMSEQEAAAKQKSEQLAGLGGTAERVQALVNAEREKLAATTLQPAQQQVATDLSATGVRGLPTDPAQLATLKQDLTALRANPSDMQALLRVNQTLGRAPGSTITPTELAQMYETSVSAISRSGSEITDTALTVSDLLTQPEFGYDLPTLSNLLGVSPDQLGNYSVGQLRDSIRNVIETEYSAGQVAPQSVLSGNAGGAERGLARAASRDVNASGFAATAADMRRLEEQLARADRVVFAGQEMSVDEMLGSDGISRAIADYINSAPGSELRTRLEQTEPQLVQFIRNNEAVLTDAAKQLGTGADDFARIQTDNAALNRVGDTTLDSSVMEKVLPGYGKLNASRLDPSNSALLSHLQSQPTGIRQQTATTQINNLASQFPDTATELASLTPEQLSKLDLGNQNSKPLRAFSDAKDAEARFAQVNKNDITDVLSFYLGRDIDEEGVAELEKELATDAKWEKYGISTSNLDDVLDSNDNGNLDNAGYLYGELSKKLGTPATLAGALEGKVGGYTPPEVRAAKPSVAQQLFMNKLVAAMGGSDSEITVPDLRRAQFSTQELLDTRDAGIWTGLPSNLRKELEKQLSTQQLRNTREIVENSLAARYPTIWENFTGNNPKLYIADLERELTESVDKQQSYINEIFLGAGSDGKGSMYHGTPVADNLAAGVHRNIDPELEAKLGKQVKDVDEAIAHLKKQIARTPDGYTDSKELQEYLTQLTSFQKIIRGYQDTLAKNRRSYVETAKRFGATPPETYDF